jgi:predicted ATPase
MGELLAAAASAGIQIVVESHSDHALNGIRLSVQNGRLAPADVAIHFFLRSELDGHPQLIRTSPEIDQNGRLSEWPDGFFDEWDAAVAELLKPTIE